MAHASSASALQSARVRPEPARRAGGVQGMPYARVSVRIGDGARRSLPPTLQLGQTEGDAMASHMELKEIKALPAMPYQDLRDDLQSGDLLFASGDYLISRTIQQFTGSPW